MLIVRIFLCLTCIWLAAVSLHAKESEFKTEFEPVEVVIWNREITTFRSTFAGLSPEGRAQRAEERINALPLDFLTGEITITEVTLGGQQGLILQLDGRTLLGLTPDDVDGTEKGSLLQAAELAKIRLREVFAARYDQMNPNLVLTGVMYTVLGLLILLLALIALRRLHQRLQGKIHEGAFSRMPPMFGLDLRPTAVGLVRSSIRLPLIAAALTVTYVWLTFSLAQFPYTKPWSVALGAWLLGLTKTICLGIVDSLPGLIMVLIIFILTRVVIRWMTAFCTSVEEGRLVIGWMQPETAKATKRMASVLIWLFAMTIAYPYFPGSSSEAFKGISVFAGLMLTLGSAGMVNQVMSGLVVVFSRTMRPGDIVKVGEVIGTVTDLGFLSTKVRTPRHEEVTIPNAVLVGTPVTNFSRTYDDFGMVISTIVTIGYDTPWRQVHAMLQMAAQRTPGLRAEPGPEVVQKALSDWYVEYELRVRLVEPEQRFSALSRLHAEIQDVFNEHNVQIMSPHFHAQPEQAVVIPKTGWAPTPAMPL